MLVFHKVVERLPGAEIDENTKIKPGAVSPDPDTWESEGLFDDEGGISLVEARERVPGWQEIWLEAQVDA